MSVIKSFHLFFSAKLHKVYAKTQGECRTERREDTMKNTTVFFKHLLLYFRVNVSGEKETELQSQSYLDL